MRTKHLLSILTILALPGVSQAQLGGLIKKAAKSAAESHVAATATNSNLKPSDAFGPELTSASLDAVVRGLAAADAKLSEAKQLHDDEDRLNVEYAKSTNAHDAERQRYQDQSRAIGHCQDS